MATNEGDIDGEEVNSFNEVHGEEGKEDEDFFRKIRDMTDDEVRDLEFETLEKATDFYDVYAKCHGFAMRKDDVERDPNGDIVARQLVCNREGKNNAKRAEKAKERRATTRTGCRARFRVSHNFVADRWRVSKFDFLLQYPIMNYYYNYLTFFITPYVFDHSHHGTEITRKKGKKIHEEFKANSTQNNNDDEPDLKERVSKLEKLLVDLPNVIIGRMHGTYETPSRGIPLTFKAYSTPEKPDTTDVPGEREMSAAKVQKVNGGVPEGRVRKFYSPSTKKKGTRKPVTATQTSRGYYITGKTNQGLSGGLVGAFIPKWLASMFQPMRKMELSDEECNLAIYIFGCPPNQEIDKKEIMVSTYKGFYEATRCELQGLKPKQMIFGDVIDLAVCMMTDDERKETLHPRNWFLPTIFAQCVLLWNSPIEKMKKRYQTKFMGNASQLSKIFVPMHDMENMHWFLLVIDFGRRELVYLDSYQSSPALHNRMSSIKIMSHFIEYLLADKSFQRANSDYGPKISEFNIVIPRDLGSQVQGSNDCAIWVINWMMQKGANKYRIEVDEGSRLKIALQLALHPCNEKRDLILSNSLKHREDFMKGDEAK